MGKRKTLQQKKLNDMRRQQSSSHEVSSPNASLNSYSFTKTLSHTHHAAPVVHTTVVTDVRKTALISLAIVAAEIILFTLLQNHVLALPFVRY